MKKVLLKKYAAICSLLSLQANISFANYEQNGSSIGGVEVENMTKNRKKRSAPTHEYRFWENGIVYYEPIDESVFSVVNRQLIYSAMAELERVANIHFIQKKGNNNFITFVNKDGCSAYVGKWGGEVSLNTSGCMTEGTILHELMHVLGFYHEQQRYDRDNYVKINYDNIEEKYKYAFDKIGKESTRFGEYDYDSIMHYGAEYFGKSYFFGTYDTIQVLDDSRAIGNRSGLSKGDKAALVKAYGESQKMNSHAITFINSGAFNAQIIVQDVDSQQVIVDWWGHAAQSTKIVMPQEFPRQNGVQVTLRYQPFTWANVTTFNVHPNHLPLCLEMKGTIFDPSVSVLENCN